MFMKAWNLLKISEQPVLTEVNDPYIQDNHHVLADISHSALNHRDVWIIKGKYPSVKTPCVLGSDASVTYESEKYVINPGMEWGEKNEFQSDTFHIIGMPHQGTFAEKIGVPKSSLYKIPEHLTMEEAAAIPLAGVTAYRALFSRAKIQKNEKLLITGIGGGVALFGLQFAVAQGLEVYVTTGSQAKLDAAIKLGAKGGDLELLAVLANGRTHNTTVSTILSRHGYGISEATIRRHRGHS